MSARDFYDQLAADYHLVYQDWEAAIERQADALDQLIRSTCPGAKEILDCSCGIGTQAIGLALRGYRVHGTDVSERSLDRARKEAERLGVWDAIVATVRAVPALLSLLAEASAVENAP